MNKKEKILLQAIKKSKTFKEMDATIRNWFVQFLNKKGKERPKGIELFDIIKQKVKELQSHD